MRSSGGNIPGLRRRWVIAGSLFLLALLLTGQWALSNRSDDSTQLSRLDAVLYDWRFQWLPPQRPTRLPIVIVDLDEFTQQREGRWPWDRRKVADLLLELQRRGAVLIGLDIVFSEPSVNPAQQLLLAPDLSGTVREELRRITGNFDGDAALAAALGRNVLLGYFLHAQGVRTGTLPAAFLELHPEQQKSNTLTTMPDYTSNLDILGRNAQAAGFLTAVPDIDGIVRRVPLVMRHGNGIYPSLTLEMARIALNAPWLRMVWADGGQQSVAAAVQVGTHVRVPVDAAGNMLAPYRGGAGSYPYLSATHVLRGDAPGSQLDTLDGALVLVGTSALGLGDLRSIPLQTAYPGVEVHANILDTILQAALGHHTLYQRPDWEPGATLALVLASGLVLGLLLPGRSPAWMLGLSSAWLILVIVTNLVLWRAAHLALPLAMQVITVVVLSSFNIAAGYLKTNRQKRKIQNMFGQYVPPDYVDRMVANPDLTSWTGEQKEMTVLFADIRDFTAMSEHLSATQLKDLLNRYLTCMTEIIFQHRGTIDKYVGDMIMAFWNAPLDDARHAEHAVAAALHMQRRMEALRREFQHEGLPVFDIGVGISTGSMNVGDMGSDYRRAYTVLGDAVNLGARLEGLTRYYGAPVLVAQNTREQSGLFLYRPIDLIRVKGRQEPVQVSAPVCLFSQADEGLHRSVARLQTALQLYRDRRWAEARAMFQSLLQDDPGQQKLYGLYLERMAATNFQILAPDWAGVYEHEHK